MEIGFIFSSPRSGSTLLSALLSSHPEIFCPPEPWVLLPLSTLMDDKCPIQTHYEMEIARMAWKELLSKEQINEILKKTSINFYKELLTKSKKRILIDKTPRNYHIINWIDDLYPDAVKIWLKRNPLDVIASHKRTWNIGIDGLLGENVSPRTFDTTLSHKIFYDYFQKDSSRKVVLSYEDLVSNPFPRIEDILKLFNLNLPSKESGISISWEIIKRYSISSFGDKTILRRQDISDSAIGKWKNVLTIEEIKKIIQVLGTKIFDRLGYMDDLSQALMMCKISHDEINPEGSLDIVRYKYLNYINSAYHESTDMRWKSLINENASLLAQLKNLENNIEQLQESLNKHIKTLDSSLSWKITAPLRKIYGLLSGRNISF